ncbi:ArsR/SmtB family transcription factor [Actinomadura rupiterrae]|uniref:ArsR/SmtB family transcription factor n=1 Tax=Actinomadura rupiterrae TaxID=559627 RepID=UPI0020A26C25|nr:DUF5937 family protein [Actinomadura rupiterrae]MCP2343237.1 DNA-binding transcriptional ArsR family regulator [Actinomadura rupiterrae]
MLELTFSADDLAYTRFAISPLWEAVAAARVLKHPAEHPLHRRWAEAVRPRLDGVRLAPLLELIGPRVIAAFACPPPASPAPDLDLELAALRLQPHERVVRDRATLGLPPSSDPQADLDQLADTVAAFWDAALAPYWPRVRTLLDGDILYRARLLASGGAQRLFADLSPGVSWIGDGLRVPRNSPGAVPLDGRGLLLVPSAFTWPKLFSLTAPGWQPLLRYPARGVGTLWERTDRNTPEALARILGRSRARLLTLLDEPASTGDLAVRTGMSPGGTSQHLTALRDAGLVSAHRAGRYVLYARTRIAEALLDPSS